MPSLMSASGNVAMFQNNGRPLLGKDGAQAIERLLHWPRILLQNVSAEATTVTFNYTETLQFITQFVSHGSTDAATRQPKGISFVIYDRTVLSDGELTSVVCMKNIQTHILQSKANNRLVIIRY